MHLDATLALFWLSLGISTAAVVLFVWLMRETPKGVRREAEGEAEDAEPVQDPSLPNA